MHRPLATLASSRDGATALEFAIVGLPFVTLLVGTLAVAFNLYLQFAMDYALQVAVRQVQLGLVASTLSSADFAAKVFCPVFVVFAPCTGIVVSVQPVSDYDSAVAVTAAAPPTAFCVGAPGQLMYARAVYQAPVFGQVFAAGTGPGTSGNTIVSAAAFANENPSGAAVRAGGGC